VAICRADESCKKAKRALEDTKGESKMNKQEVEAYHPETNTMPANWVNVGTDEDPVWAPAVS
jgi:hypothetical protein